MFTEESDFSLVTSSLAKIYEPVCSHSDQTWDVKLKPMHFLINKQTGHEICLELGKAVVYQGQEGARLGWFC